MCFIYLIAQLNKQLESKVWQNLVIYLTHMSKFI